MSIEKLRALVEKWRDPDFWAKTGAAMDSEDCSIEIAPLIAELEREQAALRNALIAHRKDLHQYSTRSCVTCRKSALALGIGNKVPNTCADARHDRIALKENL